MKSRVVTENDSFEKYTFKKVQMSLRLVCDWFMDTGHLVTSRPLRDPSHWSLSTKMFLCEECASWDVAERQSQVYTPLSHSTRHCPLKGQLQVIL